jgi:probable F420-dependent oxidoreductase
VLIIPYRNPIVTAKVLSTLDVLSQGRVVLGAGVGWMAEEFAYLNSPYRERGARTDEYLKIIKTLWTQEQPEFHGRFFDFSDLRCEPRPVQKPHPPIWIGGESAAAMRRVVRLGDAWFPGTNNPAHRLDTTARLGAAIDQLRSLAKQAGRDPAKIDLACSIQWPVAWSADKATDGSRRLFTGNAADMASDVAALEKIGVRHVALHFAAGTVEETCARIERFGQDLRLASAPSR